MATQDATEATGTEDEQPNDIDFRLVALRELFAGEHHTVKKTGDTRGDYSVAIAGGCFGDAQRTAVRRLGFTQNTTHCSIIDGDHHLNHTDDQVGCLRIHLEDTRE